jgi:GAF domain-containing protein
VAEVFDVSLTVITVTEPALQVWYDRGKAVAGTDTEWPLPPCCQALNAAVLADGGTLSSADLVRDPRFADAGVATPVVTAEGLRLFAGTPLKLASEVVVGTLCLYDPSPRSLGNDELELLARMARELVAPLDAEAGEARRRTPGGGAATDGPWQPDPATT